METCKDREKNRNNLYIPSIDAKDLCIAMAASGGYTIMRNKGRSRKAKVKRCDFDLKRFINSFDYSLDLIELRKVAKRIYSGTGEYLSFRYGGGKGKKGKWKEFSSRIINVTFKYSVKEFNHLYGGLYVRFGFDFPNDQSERSFIADEKTGKLLAFYADRAMLSSPPNRVRSALPRYVTIEHDEIDGCYYFRVRNPASIPTVYGRAELRQMLYSDGFTCDGIKYCRFKRSSGSARVGKCLFIDERLYEPMHQSEKCGLSYERGDSIDLAAIEAYISLTSSSIIDTIAIAPENILLVEDYESVFKEEAVCTDADDNNQLVTEQRLMTIKNSIWDGQSLIDSSLMSGRYQDKGCILLRNKFFKSCCFNTNIQLYFKDFGITEISQLNGKTKAEKIEDIKLITTPNSIKYLKFGSFEKWLKNIFPEFGIVKYDKNTHFFDGRLVQGNYQLINTLQLSRDEVNELIQPELDYLSMLNTDLDVLRFHLKMYSNPNKDPTNIMPTKNDVVCNLLQYDCGFERTKIFNEFKHDLCKAYQKNMKRGHILLNGTYATLFGNPYEMLKQSIGRFDGTSSMEVGTVHNVRFPYGSELLGCRSPSVAIGNLLLVKNVEHLEIDRYFNLTNNIVCINSINENILERLSGADFDSDTMLITDNPIMIAALKRNYEFFKVPTRNVNPPKKNRIYNAKDLADLDIKTGTNKIGEIINLSQELNSLLWDKVYYIGKPVNECFDEIREIYYDACQLDVMSNIEIDSAKKEYSVSNIRELQKMRDKYSDVFTHYNKKIKPKFLGFIAQTKGYYDPKHKDYLAHNTSMDYLLERINKFKSKYNKSTKTATLTELFKPSDYDPNAVSWYNVNKIISMSRELSAQILSINTQKSLSNTEKFDLINIYKEELAQKINQSRLNKHTIYQLLNVMERKENASIRSLLLYILFNFSNESIIEFMKSFKKIETDIIEIDCGSLNFIGKNYEKV